MLKRLAKPLPLMLLLLLSAAYLYKPEWRVVEYDEEIKLHDGSKIWIHVNVHHKRILNDRLKYGYIREKVEASWETGFEKVGRKTFSSNNYGESNIMLIDKYDDKWYILATMNPRNEMYKYGLPSQNNERAVLFVLNKNGEYEKPTKGNIPIFEKNVYFFNKDILHVEDKK